MSWTYPLKHTCSWHDKLIIILWILNRQAKISLCIITEFVGLKSKMYSLIDVDNEENKKAKWVEKT